MMSILLSLSFSACGQKGPLVRAGSTMDDTSQVVDR